MRTKIEGSEGSKTNQRAFLLAWCKMMARGWEENQEVLKAQMNIILIALTSCAIPADGPIQRKLDDGVILRHTWPIQVMPALPVMPDYEPVGERWYLTTDGD